MGTAGHLQNSLIFIRFRCVCVFVCIHTCTRPTNKHHPTTTEAEYMAASEGGKEVVYIRAIVKDFGHPQQGNTEIYEDNLVEVAMSGNPAPHPEEDGNILIRF